MLAEFYLLEVSVQVYIVCIILYYRTKYLGGQAAQYRGLIKTFRYALSLLANLLDKVRGANKQTDAVARQSFNFPDCSGRFIPPPPPTFLDSRQRLGS